MPNVDEQIAKTQAAIDAINAKIRPLNERLVRKVEELNTLKEKRDRDIDPSTLTIEQHLEGGDNGTVVRNERAQNFFWEIGFAVSGFYPETGQRALYLTPYRFAESEIDLNVAAVEKVLPYLRPIRGRLHIDIMDPECSAAGSYSLQTADAGCKTFSVVLAFARRETVLMTGNLREAIAYIVENCWRERDHNDE